MTRALPILEQDRRICRMIFDELCVLANGDIVCSCGDPSGKRVYGNVHRDRIAPIYNGADYQSMRLWQLENPPASWCPVIDQSCGGRVSRPTALDRPDARSVRMLQIEPVSHCNLECPACPVTHFGADPAYRSDRVSQLPLETMLDVVGQLPELEKILFYNFGEPFLHPKAIDFLREVRRLRPEVVLHTSTNGLAFTPEKVEAIARERLLDRIVFSIDGATQDNYARYRVGGRLERALGSLTHLVQAARDAGTRESIEIIWQFILFEWNDSNEELARARRKAEEIGVPISWILTHTDGASRRFRQGAPELREVLGIEDPWSVSTCDLRAEALDRDGGVAEHRYRAEIRAGEATIDAIAKDRFGLRVEIRNLALRSWAEEGRGAVRLGVQLRRRGGGRLRELAAVPLLPHELQQGSARIFYDTWAPDVPGEYDLLLDLVEEGVTWFHERGSAPCVIPMKVREGVPEVWPSDAVAVEIGESLLLAPPPRDNVAVWSRSLAEGVATRTIASWILEASRTGIRPDRLEVLAQRVQSRFLERPALR